MAFDQTPKAPPHNLAAEAALLGALLFENETYWTIDSLVHADDFYAPAHKWLYRRIQAAVEAGKTADGVTLQAAADKAERFKEVGGARYLVDLLDAAAFGPEIRDYARMISALAARRALITAATAITEMADANETSTADVLAASRAELDKIEERHLESAGSVADTADAVFEENPAASLLLTGYPSLDRSLGGLERGAVSYLGGRPGIGKTAAAICIAANVADAGYSVGFFSADMQGHVLKQRLAFYLAFLDGTHTPFFSEMRKPESPWLTPDFRRQMAGFLKGHVGQRFLVDDKANVRTSHFNYQIRAWKRECERRRLPPLGLVIVDHLGKVTPQQAARGLYEKTSYATNELLEAAKDHPEIATLCLVQLSRVSDKERRRPQLHDMRDSGKIEEDASAVVLLHREDFYLQQTIKDLGTSDKDREAAKAALSSCRGHAEFIIGKNRNGEPDVVTLRHTIGKNIIREPNQATEKVQEEQEELF